MDNSRIKSYEIRSGTWEFYRNENYDGIIRTSRPGKYANLSASFNRGVRSLICLEDPERPRR
ncbi:beta/gamma crystallin-related protein [Roseicella aerolata]|uniref:Beta/gamma crystallin family protein n=1 Tax=Roseicella aerolata TaxID=2883479 RepID=A0A9X1IIH7_9PROT|nr:beta/gamma crystallin family protein [Roseicella aerolata]